ncbi:MAG: hypothetical protein D6B26_08115 [Spirochaetaceae bacterium]|nr:MAG: hypothetical protein D6B26_08115 [Spirochaetaceae bacterium]
MDVRNSGIMSEARLYIGRSYLELGIVSEANRILGELMMQEGAPAEVRGFAAALHISSLYDDQDYQLILAIREMLPIAELSENWAKQVLLLFAETYYALGEDDAARELYAQLTDEQEMIASAAFQRLYQLANRSGSQEAAQAAVREAEHAMAGKSAQLQKLWLRVGLDSFEAGNRNQAELYLRRVWDLRGIHPVDQIVPLYLAEIAEGNGDYQQGIAILSQYTGRSDTVLFRLGSLLSKSGDWPAAEQTLASLLLEYPQTGVLLQAQYLLAYVLVQQEKYSAALDSLKKLTAAGVTGSLHEHTLRLEAHVFRKIGRLDDAANSLKSYTTIRSDDIAARIEYSTILFEQGRHDIVEREISGLLEQKPGISDSHPAEYARIVYVRGLSALVGGDYSRAGRYFSPFTAMPKNRAVSLGADVVAVHPYNIFYHAWSHYQNGEYRQSFSLFQRLVNDYPDSSLSPRAAYLAGWSAFSDGRYQAAIEMLPLVSAYDVDPDLLAGSRYLLGQSHVENGSYDDALLVFRSVYQDMPDSAKALSAHYAYADTLVRMGQLAAAADEFHAVYSRYSGDFLGSEALFRQAQLLIDMAERRKAQEALFQYRKSYPDGERVDHALYLGGQLAVDLAEPSGALVLWNRVIQEHRDSPYRFDAMYDAATLYRDRGEYRVALNLLSEAVARYPDQSEAAGAPELSSELVLLVSGISRREAELRVEIEKNDGLQTAAGRRAVLDLGQLLILDSFDPDAGIERLMPVLTELAAQKNNFPDEAAEAQLLLGEYEFRQAQYGRALDRFVSAASTVGDNQELLARALLRGAESALRDNKPVVAQQLAQRIRDAFAGTKWEDAVNRLMEAQ